jgi:hypothetical protein
MVIAMRFFIVGYLICALAACSRQPSLDRETLRSIFAEANALMEAEGASSSREVPESQLQRTIRSLEPQKVRLDSDGLYIRMSSLLVWEWGYFVPRHSNTFAPKLAGDPSFTRLGEGVFWYEIKG